MFNTQSLKLHSFEELENHLRNCIHWNSTDVIDQYDTVGITLLLNALLDNLEKKTHESNYEDLKNILDKKNLDFLKKLTQ